MMSNSDLNFFSNIVTGMQPSKKRIGLTEEFKSKFNHNGFLFIQETHSSIKNEKASVNYLSGILLSRYA